MDSKKFEEIISCGICFEFFNENNKCPRILSCQSCLVKVLSQSPTCPACRGHIQSRIAELITVNFSFEDYLISSANQDNTSPEKPCSRPTYSRKLESEGFCSEHSNYKELRCMDCESWICGVCGMLYHKYCRTLLVKEAYKELKLQVAQKVRNELEIWNKTSLDVAKALSTFEVEKKELAFEICKSENDLPECLQRIEKLNLLITKNYDMCDNLRRLLAATENSTGGNEFFKAMNELEEFMSQRKKFVSQFESLDVYCLKSLSSTVEDLRKLCEEKSVFAVESENEKILYGKVTVHEGQIWISSFQPENPRGQLFPLKKIQHKFTSSENLPQKVFLKLAPIGETNVVADVVVKLIRTSPRARNFVLLCSALKGESYKGRTLDRDNSLNYQLCTTLASVVERIDSQSNVTEMKVGMVVGNRSDSGFIVVTKNVPCSAYQIGVIVSGLQKLTEIDEPNLMIKDCGLVID